MIDLIGDMNFLGNRATGVQYIHRGILKTVFATKEVILSAGAIGSPQILLMSGIGPAHHLEQLKVMSTLDLSCLYVVKNLRYQYKNDFRNSIVDTNDPGFASRLKSSRACFFEYRIHNRNGLHILARKH